MVYPATFEHKVGFDAIRRQLCGLCLCTLGTERVGALSCMTDAADVAARLEELREFQRLQEERDDFPLQDFYDCRATTARLRLKGTHMEEEELFDLMRALNTVHLIRQALRPQDEADDDTATLSTPRLWALAEPVRTFPDIVRRIAAILDKYGHMRDNASAELFRIRTERRKIEGSISHSLNAILRTAQSEGLVESGVTPTMRDGRLVIPVAPAMKRKLSGIVHDESASGKTIFIEPTVVVEANNRIRELEGDERREVIRILTEMSDTLRPLASDILDSYNLLADIDLLQAKAALAEQYDALVPELVPKPHIDLIHAVHPLLAQSLKRQGKDVVPLDITLGGTSRLLIISGPNAGGKSVCLKTVALLQYMLQCGLAVPVGERSSMGVFRHLMIDIGDEQSIDDDLSTYSSHLRNMKTMLRTADDATLLLIDEFGTGTEPQIGGAIAEAVLDRLWRQKAWGVITTHYQNLKHFADAHDGVANGAMLYDRHLMKPLFQLEIGRPGSSFAIEIARQTGLPDDVIQAATDIVGQDYIDSDKYLQDIVRDKRYWQQKREAVHQREKDVERTITRYETSVEEIEHERRAILRRAKQQADELLAEANKRIENTIREIREAEAERNRVREVREELADFRADVQDIDNTPSDEAIEKKMQAILARRERKAKRKEEKGKKAETPVSKAPEAEGNFSLLTPHFSLTKGSVVHLKGTKTTGRVEQVKGKYATIIIGDMRTKMPLSSLEQSENATEAAAPKSATAAAMAAAAQTTRATRSVVDAHRQAFQPDLDVRGMRADDALLTVQHFIDDATLLGQRQVRILHGKGNGILHALIQQFLRTVPAVDNVRDEHVQFGGAGITVVSLS